MYAAFKLVNFHFLSIIYMMKKIMGSYSIFVFYNNQESSL